MAPNLDADRTAQAGCVCSCRFSTYLHACCSRSPPLLGCRPVFRHGVYDHSKPVSRKRSKLLGWDFGTQSRKSFANWLVAATRAPGYFFAAAVSAESVARIPMRARDAC